MDIILASTSPYRKRLLERLQLPFRCVAPDTDETPLPAELPLDMARRLAEAKARSVASRHPRALVIGSDQVAALGGRIMGKPGNHEAARAQLAASSANEVRFATGLAVLPPAGGPGQFHVELFSVHFRELDARMIENYLQRERPYDCAGSFKCEALGIALFERMSGNDPTSLEGLPLIALTTLLSRVGVNVLSPPVQ
jgi:MAF protein